MSEDGYLKAKAQASMAKAHRILARAPPPVQPVRPKLSRFEKCAESALIRVLKLEKVVREQQLAIDRLRRWGH